jgi:hypothetical protein
VKFRQAIHELLHNAVWEYGTCKTVHAPRHAKRDRITGEVWFVLWEKGDRQGEHVYAEDFWVRYDAYWWPNFKPNSAIDKKSFQAHTIRKTNT